MEEQDSYRFIQEHESLESASESVQKLIRTKTPLDEQQSLKTAGMVSDKLSEEVQSVSP